MSRPHPLIDRAKSPQSGGHHVNGDAKIGGDRWATNPTLQPRPRLATIEQAAGYLAGSRRSVWRLIERGELVPIRFAGLRRTWVEWAALDELVARAREDGRAT